MLKVNKTKFKIKTRVAVNLVKGVCRDLGEKYNKISNQTMEDYQNQLISLERELQERDRVIEKKLDMHQRNEEKIHIQKSVTQKKKREAEIITQQLRTLELVEQEMMERNAALQKDIQRLKASQTDTQALYNDMHREMKGLEHRQEMEKEIDAISKEQEVDVFYEEEKKSRFGLPLPFFKKEEPRKKNYRLSVVGDIYSHEDVAKHLREKMHHLQSWYSDEEMITALLAQNEQALQYRFVAQRYMGDTYQEESFEEVTVYYFKTSSDPSYSTITLHQEVRKGDDIEIVQLAEGERVFIPSQRAYKDNTDKIDEYNEIGRWALKELGFTENEINKKREEQEREEKQDDLLVMHNGERIVLPSK